MMTAIAPASCTILAFCVKPQVPRSTSAILPATAAALVKAEQASVVAGPAASDASAAATTGPVTPAALIGVPQPTAIPNWYTPAMEAGVRALTSVLPKERTLGKAA